MTRVEQLKHVTTFPSRAAIAIILRYQSNRSGCDPSASIPSDSGASVLVESIARRGLIVGGIKGCWRIFRARHAEGVTIN